MKLSTFKDGQVLSSWLFLVSALLFLLLPRTKQYGLFVFCLGLLVYIISQKKYLVYITLAPYIVIPFLALILPIHLPASMPITVRLTLTIIIWSITLFIANELIRYGIARSKYDKWQTEYQDTQDNP